MGLTQVLDHLIDRAKSLPVTSQNLGESGEGITTEGTLPMGHHLGLYVHMEGNELGLVGELAIILEGLLVNLPPDKLHLAVLAFRELVLVLGIDDLAFCHRISVRRGLSL